MLPKHRSLATVCRVPTDAEQELAALLKPYELPRRDNRALLAVIGDGRSKPQAEVECHPRVPHRGQRSGWRLPWRRSG